MRRAEDFFDELDDRQFFACRIFEGRTSESRRSRREENICLTTGGFRESWESEENLGRKRMDLETVDRNNVRGCLYNKIKVIVLIVLTKG